MIYPHPHAGGSCPLSRSTSRLLVVLTLTIAAASAACQRASLNGNATALTSAAQVRALSPEEAERGRPVRLHGVVTYFVPTSTTLAVQDATAGIFVDTSQLQEE